MSDHDQPIAANVLDRDFTAAAPNQRWVGDTTEFVIGEQRQALPRGDPRSVFALRRRLGDQRRQRPASHAQGPRDGGRAPLSRAGLLHHSDRGCTYTSEDYQTMLGGHGITCSMSRRGDCYDNAGDGGFFSTVKKEQAERFPSTATPRWAVRLHRGVLQPAAPPFDPRPDQSGGLRTPGPRRRVSPRRGARRHPRVESPVEDGEAAEHLSTSFDRLTKEQPVDRARDPSTKSDQVAETAFILIILTREHAPMWLPVDRLGGRRGKLPARRPNCLRPRQLTSASPPSGAMPRRRSRRTGDLPCPCCCRGRRLRKHRKVTACAFALAGKRRGHRRARPS